MLPPDPAQEGNPSPPPASPDDVNVLGPASSDFSGNLIVGIHGMGDQARNDFSQILARLFARYFALNDKDGYQARLLPLGAWDGGRETSVDDPALQFRPAGKCRGLEEFAFAEIHWADIARSLEDDGYRLEEATHWARTVVERLAQRHSDPRKFGPKQFHLAGFVIEEIAETLALIQKVAMAGKLFKLSKKDVDTTLTRYLCDVQQVGDYQRQREKFRDRFLNRIEKLHRMYPKAKIHLIAHSEGTAISFFSLLTALSAEGREEVRNLRGSANRESQAPETEFRRVPERLEWAWIGQLVSFATMGSPIDKHIHLWPEMWRTFERTAEWTKRPAIRWRNYYDYADPVGYELDSAKAKLKSWKCEAFEFETGSHDHGFRRYPFPGKAHLDYFYDDGLFAHVIEDAVGYKDEVVARKRDAAKEPKGRLRGWCSPILPFLIVFALMFAAVYVLDRGLLLPPSVMKGFIPGAWQGASLPESPATEWVRDHVCREFPSAGSHCLLGQWALLMGTTMLARILRLTRTPLMNVLAFGCFLLGCGLFLLFPGVTGLEAGYRFIDKSGPGDLLALSQQKVIAFASLSVLLAWLADYIACLRRWRPVWALRIFIILGAAFVGIAMVLPRLGLVEEASSMALVSSLAGFAVLWWIGTLLFDLAFCWQRYINAGRSWLDRIRPETATGRGASSPS